MAMPKRKVSKMKRRQRQAHNRYEGVQATFCTNCGEPAAPHTVCKHCGTYKGKHIWLRQHPHADCKRYVCHFARGFYDVVWCRCNVCMA